MSTRLSSFRTEHRFDHYAEFETVDEFLELRRWAAGRGVRVFVLGNGSNTLFTRRRVRSLVLKNRLARDIRELSGGRFEVSSSVLLSVLLKTCLDRRLDSFYYLASVPATVGGAIAMNAGRGREHNKTIFDFVESVSFVEGAAERTLRREEIPLGYRSTPFTGVHDRLITRAVFRFGPIQEPEGVDPIAARIEHSLTAQDLSAPNCGSVFKTYTPGILRRLRGFRIGGAKYSPKTINWILNQSKSPRPIVWLIRTALALHRLTGRRAELELIRAS